MALSEFPCLKCGKRHQASKAEANGEAIWPSSDPACRRQSRMPDDLRTRIAAVLSKHRIYHRAVPFDWGCSCYEWQGKSADHDLHQADAVIEELSLMIDDSYRISYGHAFIVHGYYEVRD
jgi:hypothetical protein